VPIVDDEKSVHRRDRRKNSFFLRVFGQRRRLVNTDVQHYGLSLAHIGQFSYSQTPFRNVKLASAEALGSLTKHWPLNIIEEST
jgi:hypothetical protein